MKLTIWRQFSSNHSARFTIVGVFETAKEALDAQVLLENLLQRIKEWYDEDDSRWEMLFEDFGGVGKSDVEQEIAKQYEIDWDLAIGWFDNYRLVQYENLLVVSEVYSADSGAYPVDLLLKKLGASVAVDGDRIWYEDMRFGTVTIQCVVPSQDVADILLKQYRGNLDTNANNDEIRLKLGPFHISFSPILRETEPLWFAMLKELRKHQCHSIEMAVDDKKFGDEKYEELWGRFHNLK